MVRQLFSLLIHLKSNVQLYTMMKTDCLDDAEDPASQPVFWVSKWVDYSDKYGMGYQLCDNSVGVLFNDSTRIVLATDGE